MKAIFERWRRGLDGPAQRNHVGELSNAGGPKHHRAFVEEGEQDVCTSQIARGGAPGGAVLGGLVAAFLVDLCRFVGQFVAIVARGPADTTAGVAGAVQAEALAVRHLVACANARRTRALGVAGAVQAEAFAVCHRVMLANADLARASGGRLQRTPRGGRGGCCWCEAGEQRDQEAHGRAGHHHHRLSPAVSLSLDRARARRLLLPADAAADDGGAAAGRRRNMENHWEHS